MRDARHRAAGDALRRDLGELCQRRPQDLARALVRFANRLVNVLRRLGSAAKDLAGVLSPGNRHGAKERVHHPGQFLVRKRCQPRPQDLVRPLGSRAHAFLVDKVIAIDLPAKHAVLIHSVGAAAHRSRRRDLIHNHAHNGIDGHRAVNTPLERTKSGERRLVREKARFKPGAVMVKHACDAGAHGVRAAHRGIGRQVTALGMTAHIQAPGQMAGN